MSPAMLILHLMEYYSQLDLETYDLKLSGEVISRYASLFYD